MEVDGAKNGLVAIGNADRHPLDIHRHRPAAGNLVNVVSMGQDVSHDRFRDEIVPVSYTHLTLPTKA